MNLKKLLKSKTFYAGLATIFTGISLIVSGNKSEGIQLTFTGLIAIFLRDGINKNGN